MLNNLWILPEWKINKVIIKDYKNLYDAQTDTVDTKHVYSSTSSDEIQSLIGQINTLSKESSLMVSFSPGACALTRVYFLDASDNFIYELSIYGDRIQRPDSGGFHHAKEEKEKEKTILNILEKIRHT
jgi:hypothetical protein